MGDVCWRLGTAALAMGLALVAATPAAMAQKVSFKDPKDDDNGPGAYTYPTDPVYKPGSFDMTAFTLRAHGDKVDLDVEMAAKLEDPWKTGSGFSVQMVFVFVQTLAEKPAAGGKAGAAKAGGKKKGGTPSAGGKADSGKADSGKADSGKADSSKADSSKADSGKADGSKAATDKADTAKAAAGETGAAATLAGAKAAGAEAEPGTAPAPADTDEAETDKAAGKKSTANMSPEEKAAARKAARAKAATERAAAAKKHGFTQGLPGLQVQFAPADGWDRCIILSPEPAARVRAEVEAKAPAMKDAIVIPARVKGSGHVISATIDRKALGPGDPTDWGYQVVIASSDPYPAADSLLVRKVTETESQHRFGGGSDGDCAPNVLDLLAGDGEGEAEEVRQQHEMLQYECNPDHAPKTLATLTMVRVDKDED